LKYLYQKISSIILLSIYDKSETSSIADSQIAKLIQDFQREINKQERSEEESKNLTEDPDLDSPE